MKGGRGRRALVRFIGRWIIGTTAVAALACDGEVGTRFEIPEQTGTTDTTGASDAAAATDTVEETRAGETPATPPAQDPAPPPPTDPAPPQVLPTWDVQSTPPRLEDARRIVLPMDVTPVLWPAYNTSCEGLVYYVALGDDEDALVTFAGQVPLAYPVIVHGGRNVHVRGLDLSLMTQAGCVPGAVSYGPRSSFHPTLPASRALGVSAWGTVFIEGTFLELNGHDGDCIVSNNSDFIAHRDLRSTARVVIQSSACHGIEGDSDTGDGSSGEHGDAFQIQGGALQQVNFENFSVKQSCEGVVLNFPVGDVVIRRFDYTVDPRFWNDDPYDPLGWGGAFADDDHVQTFSIESYYVRYADPTASGWVQVAGHHYVAPERAGEVVYGRTTEAHPEVRFERPSGGDFAPAESLGRRYQSPHENR